MDNKKLGAFIILLIGVVVSLALLNPIADSVQEMTERYQVINESMTWALGSKNASQVNVSYEHNLSHSPTGQNRIICPIGSVVVGNESENYTVTTDYTVNATHGHILFLNTSTTRYGGNNTAVDYQWCAAGYVSGASNTVVKLILTFAGLAIIAFAIYYGIKEWL